MYKGHDANGEGTIDGGQTEFRFNISRTHELTRRLGWPTYGYRRPRGEPLLEPGKALPLWLDIPEQC